MTLENTVSDQASQLERLKEELDSQGNMLATINSSKTPRATLQNILEKPETNSAMDLIVQQRDRYKLKSKAQEQVETHLIEIFSLPRPRGMKQGEKNLYF